jgi:hypothetical protein
VCRGAHLEQQRREERDRDADEDRPAEDSSELQEGHPYVVGIYIDILERNCGLVQHNGDGIVQNRLSEN